MKILFGNSLSCFVLFFCLTPGNKCALLLFENPPCLPPSSYLIDTNKRAAAKLVPQQMVFPFLQHPLGGCFACLSSIGSALPALIACVSLPSGSGASASRGEARVQANSEAADTRPISLSDTWTRGFQGEKHTTWFHWAADRG